MASPTRRRSSLFSPRLSRNPSTTRLNTLTGQRVITLKNQLNMDLTVLLYKNGYPQERDEGVSEKVLEQTENLKAESNCSFEAMKWSKQATSDLQRRTA